jgi:tRNA pseudouridine38-40 synthase
MRLALGVEYDGSGFSGWQYQDHSPSVQEAVETALAKVANHPVRVHCAGRTDTGVHATGQVIHFDTEAVREMRSWIFGANANLPKSVAILWARPVTEDFHARFSATRRRYRYVIFNRHVRPTFLAYRTSWCYRDLDEGRMAEAAQYLIGKHDFSSYRAVACQAKSPVREVHELRVSRQGELVYIDIEANAFLHHMVRNIAGVLMEIGRGEREPVWAREVLDYRDRALGGVTAPPYGLYLTRVSYPEAFGLPVSDALPFY